MLGQFDLDVVAFPGSRVEGRAVAREETKPHWLVNERLRRSGDDGRGKVLLPPSLRFETDFKTRSC